MERSENFLRNTTVNLLQSFPNATSGDSVVVSIYDIDDATQDISAEAMEFVSGVTWKYAWSAPNESHTYLVDFHNQDLDVHYYLYARLLGQLVGSPGGSTLGDTYAVLKKEFLLYIDEYNADEPTGDGSNDDQSGRCINLALQRIYAILKDTKFLDANPDTTSLVSTASQSYIELSAISDLDEILALSDRTNDITLRKVPFWEYRMKTPDPDETTGVSLEYSRLFNRIYLNPQPTSALTYVCDYKKNLGYLSNASDRAGIPSKCRYWLFAEAHVVWQRMEDPKDVATIQSLRAMALDEKEVALADIRGGFGEVLETQSHFRDYGNIQKPYDSPIGS